MSILDSIKKLFDNFEKDMLSASRAKENESEKPKEKITIKYEETKTWLDATSKPIISDIETHLKSTLESMKQAKSRLEKDTKALENAKPEETRDKRLERAIINNRHALTSRLSNYTHSIKITEKMKPKDSPEFFENIRENTRTLMIDTAKNFYFVNSGFPDITEDIKEDLLNIGKTTDTAIEYLKPLKYSIKAIEDSYIIIEELDISLPKKKDHENMIRDEEKRIKELEKNRHHLDKEIKAIEKSAPMKALSALENDHKKTESEIASIKDRIINTISPLSRTLKKYGRIAQHSGKDEETLMSLYMEDPVTALEKDDNLSLLKKIAEDLELRITKGTISVKDKMKEKTVSAITRLKEENDLAGLKQNLMALRAKEARDRSEIESSDIAREKTALIKKHTETMHEIKSGTSSMQEKKKILETLNQEITEKVRALEKNLNSIGNFEVKITHTLNSQHENSKQ